MKKTKRCHLRKLLYAYSDLCDLCLNYQERTIKLLCVTSQRASSDSTSVLRYHDRQATRMRTLRQIKG